MGWKNVKEHYRISHIVQVTEEGICIGSGFIHNLIVIGSTGELVKRYDSNADEHLERYQREMDADPEMLRLLAETPDTFSKSITVYTYEDGNILEKQCEELGYPNVTHDGFLMYENTYSTDKMEIVRMAIEGEKNAIRTVGKIIHGLEEKISDNRAYAAEHALYLRKLEECYCG